jgi:hypothetical protein
MLAITEAKKQKKQTNKDLTKLFLLFFACSDGAKLGQKNKTPTKQ